MPILETGFRCEPIDILPLAVQFLISVPETVEAKYDFGPFWPIVVIGETLKSVTFEKGFRRIYNDQLIRIGFCNNEFRLLVQIKTQYGSEELVSSGVLPAGVYLVVVTFDVEEKRIKLFIDGNQKEEVTLRGSLQMPETISFGHGGSAGFIWFCHVYQTKLKDHAQILSFISPPPEDTSNWRRDEKSIHKIFVPGENANIALYSWYSRGFLFHSRVSGNSLRRVVRLLGLEASVGSLRDDELFRLIATTVKDITDKLEKIVSDSTKTELDLLMLFRDCPALGMLLHPDMHRQWREQEIQLHGRIDFVFELVDGTFLVIEIESHCRSLFTRTDELTQSVRHAIEQVKTWIRGIARMPAIASRLYGTDNQDSFSALVVVGRKSEINNPVRSERWLAEKFLTTWDDVIARGRLIEHRFNNPSVCDHEWEA